MNEDSENLNYETTERYGNNRMWCCNKVISGTKFYQAIISFILFSFPFLLILTIMVKINKKIIITPIIVNSILYLITIFFTLRGAFTDPGILTRQNKHFYYSTKRPVLRQVINGHLITLNYCYTCSLFRPPRTSHCAMCDNCTLRFDHHCLWLGTCIGRRNYKHFYFLVLFLNISALFHIGYSIYFIIFQRNSSQNSLDLLVYIGMGIVIVFDLMFIVFFIGKLFGLHTKLVSNNLTFYEHIKKKWNKPPGVNPFNKGTWQSWKRLIFKFVPKNYLFDIFEVHQSNTNSEENQQSIYENTNQHLRAESSKEQEIISLTGARMTQILRRDSQNNSCN
jgi:hypothetical protein